jgi:hypothetical protein
VALLASAILLAFCFAGPLPVTAAEQEPAQARIAVDLELVLAVDASSSVTSEEFTLQMRGLAEAFRHPGVQGAVRASGDRGIAVSLIQWSESNNQSVSIDWRRLHEPETLESFAEEIELTPRFVVGGGTAIGSAIKFAMKHIDKGPYAGVRRVIDISGDGRANQGPLPPLVRDEVVARGITINGLAILNEDQFVDQYYVFNVIGGTGAFMMTATDFEDFAAAIVRKLIQEISGVPIVEAPVLSGPRTFAFAEF